MRFHKPIPPKNTRVLSEEKIKKFSSYQINDPRKKVNSIDVRGKMRHELSDAIERRSNSTKFKSLN